MRRRTLVQAVEKRGTGAAHGQPCAVRLQPAAWGNGLALVFPNERVALKPSNLEGSRELVWFGDESELWGSEPMLAACVVLGVTDLDIVVEGEDCPVLDGLSLIHI